MPKKKHKRISQLKSSIGKTSQRWQHDAHTATTTMIATTIANAVVIMDPRNSAMK